MEEATPANNAPPGVTYSKRGRPRKDNSMNETKLAQEAVKKRVAKKPAPKKAPAKKAAPAKQQVGKKRVAPAKKGKTAEKKAKK